MKKRKINGFTLIELLAVIVIIGLIAAIGGYFAINAIESSKKKSYEVSKQSVMKNAITYASEFLEEEDWVPDVDDSFNEKSCIDVQWLVNKGYSKKDDFLDAPIDNNRDEYKLYSDSVVIINRNKSTKAISSSDLVRKNEVEEKTCTNTLKAYLKVVETTTRRITVSADCKIKDIVPSDITYNFFQDDTLKYKGKNNLYIFDKLRHNSTFNFSVTCTTSDSEVALSNTTDSTKELMSPIITTNGDIITIDYNNENNSGITKKVSVNKSNSVRLYYGTIKDEPANATLLSGKTYEVDKNNIKLRNIISTKNTSATITATNTDGYNSLYENATVNYIMHSWDIGPAIFVSSDNIESDKWHKNNFSLEIIGGDEANVKYYYSTDKNNINILYTKPISITEETSGIKYYAKACIDTLGCTGSTEYIVKLDKTPPKVGAILKDTLGVSLLNCPAEGLRCELSSWQNKNIVLNFSASDTLSGINQNATFSYNKSGLSTYGNLSRSRTETLSNGKTSINISSDGSRYVSLKVCDLAGNCTARDVYFKMDTTPPNVDVSMGYINSGGAISLSCSGNTCQNNNWLNKLVTLYFSSKDSFSGVNKNATFIYNRGYLSKLDESFSKEPVVLDNNNNWKRDINTHGNRYIKLKVCDLAGNCTTREVKFKIDTDKPMITYDNKGSIEPDAGGWRNFSCKSLSGTSFFEGVDADGRTANSGGKDTLSFYKNGGDSKTKEITLTCKSNSGLTSKYVLKTNCSTSTDEYKYLCYNHITMPYTTGSITANPCSATEIVYCGGQSQRINTNCYTTDDRYYVENEKKYYPTLHYYQWGCCTDYSSSTTCREIFESK